jgi:hypothetical protein
MEAGAVSDIRAKHRALDVALDAQEASADEVVGAMHFRARCAPRRWPYSLRASDNWRALVEGANGDAGELGGPVHRAMTMSRSR